MTQPALRQDLDAMLTDLELRDFAGIKTKNRANFRMTPEVNMLIATTLAKAGIYFWFKHDNRVGTTWRNIYNPHRPETAKKPDELDNKTPNFGAMK